MSFGYLMPVVGFAILIAMALMHRRRLAQAEQTYAGFVLGTLAPKLGLRIMSGDPNANVMLAPHNTHGTRISDDKPYEWNVRLQGAPRGRAVEVVYYHRRERESEIFQRKFTYYDDAYIAVQLRDGVPDFEVVSKQSSLGPIARRHALPLQAAGHSIDREVIVASNDPGIPARVASFIARFDPGLRSYGLHLEAQGNWLRFRADDKHVSGVFYFVEQIVPLLEELADELERGAARAW